MDDAGADMLAILAMRFPDVEQLHPSGFLANCPVVHDDGTRRYVLFDEDGALLGCTSGFCSRTAILDAAEGAA